MPDDMTSRRQLAARAFTARRGELGMTQEDVAYAAGVVVRTVQNFESGKWPHADTRAKLEKALGWAAGEIDRLSRRRPKPPIDDQLLEEVRQLDPGLRHWMNEWLEQIQDEENGQRTRAAREVPP